MGRPAEPCANRGQIDESARQSGIGWDEPGGGGGRVDRTKTTGNRGNKTCGGERGKEPTAYIAGQEKPLSSVRLRQKAATHEEFSGHLIT
jgi:hypothetical protein